MDALLTPISTSPTPDPVAEANHRIANSLALLTGLVRLQASSARKNGAPLSSAEVCHMLDGVAARISTISQLHRIHPSVTQIGTCYILPFIQVFIITDLVIAGNAIA